MRRRLLALLLSQLALGWAGEAAAQPRRVIGRVVDEDPEVRARVPPRAFARLQVPSSVEYGTSVKTERRGRARIALGQGRLKRGFVVLGPKTEVEFVGALAEGRPPALGLFMVMGKLWLVFSEEAEEGMVPGEGEYWIETPGGTKTTLFGTGVYVRVDPRDKSTFVAVVAGRASVASGTGVTVELGPGEWTHVPIDGPPAPPGVIPPGDGGTPPGFPGELLPMDPPQLGGDRFNLPR